MLIEHQSVCISCTVGCIGSRSRRIVFEFFTDFKLQFNTEMRCFLEFEGGRVFSQGRINPEIFINC
jgi:hypothetical protein